MADSDATTPEEDMPGLISDSDTDSEDEDYVPPVRRRRRKRKKKGINSKKAKRQSKSKRKRGAKRKGKQVIARNTTYASKQKCCDPDAIKDFLATADCGCPAKCIKKLQMLADEGAVDAVFALRNGKICM